MSASIFFSTLSGYFKNNVLQGSGIYTYEDGSFMGKTAFDEQEVFQIHLILLRDISARLSFKIHSNLIIKAP